MLILIFFTSFFSFVYTTESSEKLVTCCFTMNPDKTITVPQVSREDFKRIIADPEEQKARRNQMYKTAFKHPGAQAKFGRSPELYDASDEVYTHTNPYDSLDNQAFQVSQVFPTAFLSGCLAVEGCPYENTDARDIHTGLWTEIVLKKINSYPESPIHLVFLDRENSCR